ncbi:DUF427 domain-containing protein [Rhizobium lusitanum]|uniref:DUF427 domain-containing protein n=1 Tax=Rhizobium lusitanum TaxID=293958 RepID=A0A6L9UI46_9HYPH|nr:DUF427 domain-containing protein [Rhizobium lusitanum]NEI73530.1 DUF427 domain-containing protein [Rhizobium lusitanum]
MSDPRMKIPDDDHPIRLRPNPSRVVVRAGGRIVADSLHALTLREANLPPVHYIPRADVAMDYLRRNDHSSHCPYKGAASYFDLAVDGRYHAKAAWSYETSYPAVASIAGYIAFVSGQIACIEEWERHDRQ